MGQQFWISRSTSLLRRFPLINNPMLPHLPKAYKEMCDLFYSQVFDAMHTAAPMLLQIPIRPQREGREGSFQDESGRVRAIDFQRQAAAVEINTENARG